MMSRGFPESDWRILRKLREVALERFCERVICELREMTADVPPSYHQRYLDVFKLIDKRDDELASAFNNPRRSAAFLQLGLIRAYGLITDDEMARFSPETRAAVEVLTRRASHAVPLETPNLSSGQREDT